MKILMIAPQPFLEPRGTPISILQRLHGLSGLGHEVDLITYHLGENTTISGVGIHRIPKVPFIKELRVGPSWQKIILDVLLFFKSALMLLANEYDVIHSHEEAAFFSMILARIFRIPHLYDMHSSLPKQLINFGFADYRPIIGLFRILERFAILTSDAVITIGSDLEELVAQIRPNVNQVMIENLPLPDTGSGTDSALLDEIRNRLDINGMVSIIYTGTFERYQGVDLLIESAQIVHRTHPNVCFILVGGKKNQISRFLADTKELQLESSVHFVGSVPLEEAEKYLEIADILVSPRIEGTSVPLKIYTYLSKGKPIIATKLPAHTLVLDGYSALLVEPTREALAEGLIKLVEDARLRKHLGAQAKKLADEKFSSTDYLLKLEKIYKTFQPSVVLPNEPSLTLK